MKKTASISPSENKKAETVEVRYLEENQELVQVVSTSSSETTIPQNFALNWVSKNTYLVLSPTQLEKIKKTAEQVFKLAQETLLEVIEQKEFASWMNSRYGAVQSLWQNSGTGLSLIRIDFAWDKTGNLQVLELNAASHSGWIRTGLVEQKTAADKIGTPLAPKPLFYAKYVLEKLGPKIAIMVKGSEHSKELELLLSQLESLGAQGQIIFLSETNAFEKVINFAPTGLFWRCHAALVEHSELVLKLAKLGLPQMPSFESLFIAGDKSFLATLRERDNTGVIPKTCVLSKSKSSLTQNLNWLEKDRVVLKPGDLARGENVFFGKNFTEKAWEEKMKEVMNSSEEWILQELCCLSKTKDGKYQDIIVFLVDGKVQGIASRVSDQEVVNVAKGGYLQAVVLEFVN